MYFRNNLLHIKLSKIRLLLYAKACINQMGFTISLKINKYRGNCNDMFTNM